VLTIGNYDVSAKLAKDVAQLTDGRWMLRGQMADGESGYSDRWCRKIKKGPFPRANSLFWKLIFL
jgi:hypothetical protein